MGIESNGWWLSRSTYLSVLMTGLMLAFVTGARAQGEPIEEIGRQEFIKSCAACHGERAKGDGPVAGLLLTEPPDLTSIRKRRGGQFPASWVYRIIDGRNEVRAHGPREMPIWGSRYRAEALSGIPLPLDISADAVVHGRILSLVFYLDFIQED